MLVVCPYDTVKRADGRVARRCAMARYIPAIPNPQGAVWSEVETLHNHTVVEVTAPKAVLDAIRADPEFVEVTPGASLSAKLAVLGFSSKEQEDLPADPQQAKAYLGRFQSAITLSPDKETIVVGGRKV